MLQVLRTVASFGLSAQTTPSVQVKDFLEYVDSDSFSEKATLTDLKARVEALATQFPIPGV